MKKNKLIFVLFFVFFSAINLFAEGEPVDSESNIKNGFNTKNESSASLEKHLFDLNDSIGKIIISLERLSDIVSKPQIWQIISAISFALITLLLSGIFILLWIDQLKLRKVLGNSQRLAHEKPVKEHKPTEESNSVSQRLLSSEFDTLKNKLDDMQYQLTKLDDKIKNQSECTSRFQSDLTSFQTEMVNIKQTIKNSNDEFILLKNDIDKNKKKLARKELVEDDPVAAFNQWAQNPHLSFPEYFTYVTNVKLEFRTKQEFTDTKTETEWIRNTIGERKYLFPNPNKIDNLSGPIDKLYKVAGTRKAIGTNSVKIINACQIKEGNFIEYQGELMLL
jgi:hypothetical protein